MFVSAFLVIFRVGELSDNLSGMSRWIEVVSVFAYFLFGALFAAVAGEDVLVVVEVVVVVFVKESFRHISD